MDAISLEVLYGKLSSISEEMQLIILKSAHSRMVNEACDATSALLDSEGRNISQAARSIPIHLGCLTVIEGYLLTLIHKVRLKMEIVILLMIIFWWNSFTRYCYCNTGIFRYQISRICNSHDSSSRYWRVMPGSASVYAHDLYSEGLRIKLTKIVEEGDINNDLLGLMKSNSRTPETLQGDLLAQIAAGSMGAKRMSKLVSEYRTIFLIKG